jgi:phosphomevalonate kinase
MRPLVAISGKRFSGKDTFARLLVEEASARGVQVELFAFANESKRLFVEQQRALGVEVDLARLLTDRDYKETWRPRLTAFTVESIAADPLVFARAVAARVDGSPHACVVTDLRLRLEVELLKPRFALHVVRLVRSDQSRVASGWQFKASVDEHHTETELDDPSFWSQRVGNDGAEAELRSVAAQVVSARFTRQ